MSVSSGSHPIQYAVRLSEYAQRELEIIVSALNQREPSTESSISSINSNISFDWYQGIRAAVRGLSQNPRRYAVQPEESRKLKEEIRREIYRHTRGSTMMYYLFYSVQDDGQDGPFVTVVHIRHTSRKPMTSKEAKDIRAGL